MSRSLKVAFVTGGHFFQVTELQRTLNALPGMDVYIQHMDDWCSAGEERATYDVVAFYHMLMAGPPEKGEWYQGAIRASLEELGKTPQGIVVLHHAILAYPQWSFWGELVGIAERSFGFHQNQNLRVTVADQAHPVTRGLEDWDMSDETYTMADPRPEDGNTILLTVDHPKSMKSLAWTRRHGQARVFCLQSGHDGMTFNNPMFRHVLARGIHWAAPSSQPAAVPATMTGVMFPAKGKAVLQDEPSPVCTPGHILCQALYSGLTNGTERNVLMGGNYGGHWPHRCGYQNVGRVIEVGAGVAEYAVGDTIFSGDFRQHVAYFAQDALADTRLLARVPASVDPRHAALFGMASVAMHDVRRAAVKLGDRVLVIGAGPIGQFTAQAARAAGAVVTVCDLDARRLEVAGRLGAHQTVSMTGDESWNLLKQIGPFDVVFEDSGAPIMDKLLAAWVPDVLKFRGTLVLIAGRQRVDYNFNCGQAIELNLVQAGHFGRDDLEQVCRLAAEGRLQIGPIIQDIVPVDQATAVYDRLRDAPGSLFGTVFDWTRPSSRAPQSEGVASR